MSKYCKFQGGVKHHNPNTLLELFKHFDSFMSRHSAVALLLKAALIQVSDNRLLGDSGYVTKQI
jgi:hypothetical protein